MFRKRPRGLLGAMEAARSNVARLISLHQSRGFQGLGFELSIPRFPAIGAVDGRCGFRRSREGTGSASGPIS